MVTEILILLAGLALVVLGADWLVAHQLSQGKPG